jgi:hypothetical protein
MVAAQSAVNRRLNELRIPAGWPVPLASLKLQIYQAAV